MKQLKKSDLGKLCTVKDLGRVIFVDETFYPISFMLQKLPTKKTPYALIRFNGARDFGISVYEVKPNRIIFI